MPRLELAGTCKCPTDVRKSEALQCKASRPLLKFHMVSNSEAELTVIMVKGSHDTNINENRHDKWNKSGKWN